jgi:hypothetical protein
VLTARGKAADNPGVGFYVITVGSTPAPESEVVAAVAQTFLGTRVGCARCHNHPFENFTQDDYYHLAAFFSEMQLNFQATPTLTAVVDTARAPGVRQPRTGRFLPPRPPDRSPMTVAKGADPRVQLAAWMTDPKNEAFAGAMVNRLWRHFFGVGLVEPVDDLRASNPPSNPELWHALNREFAAHRFDLKHPMRLILNSRTYQAHSGTVAGNVRDTRFYSHYYARRLPAEVLLDAVSQATGVLDEFPGYPVGVRALQVPDPGVASPFLSLFGRPERLSACACERPSDVTLPQLMHLQNGDTVRKKIASRRGRLARLLEAGTTDDKIVEELFLATLSRPPTAEEAAAVRKTWPQEDGREAAFRDLFWVLLNATEFTFNH